MERESCTETLRLTESELQTFETTVTITGIEIAGMIIESFDVQCTIGDDVIYDL